MPARVPTRVMHASTDRVNGARSGTLYSDHAGTLLCPTRATAGRGPACRCTPIPWSTANCGQCCDGFEMSSTLRRLSGNESGHSPRRRGRTNTKSRLHRQESHSAVPRPRQPQPSTQGRSRLVAGSSCACRMRLTGFARFLRLARVGRVGAPISRSKFR